jgi:hypothetical protein
MKYIPRALAVLTVAIIVAASLAACGDDGDACEGLNDGLHNDTLCLSGSGESPVGLFSVAGSFNVQIVGGNVGSDNTTIRVFQVVQKERGSSTKLVGTTGPKAVVEGIQVRPGNEVEVDFDFGPGEFYFIVQTDEANTWTAIVSPVLDLPAG